MNDPERKGVLHAEGRAGQKRSILRRKTLRKNNVGAIATKSFALLVVLGTAYQAMAQDATTPYPNMAPIEQYLMDRTAGAQRSTGVHFTRCRCTGFWTSWLRNRGQKQKRLRVYRRTSVDFRS